jgi:hypothetical protein
MARTGIGRTAPPSAVAVAPGNTLLKKCFPGQINVGVVMVCLILVTFATIISGGMGEVMQYVVTSCCQIMCDVTLPILVWMGLH